MSGKVCARLSEGLSDALGECCLLNRKEERSLVAIRRIEVMLSRGYKEELCQHSSFETLRPIKVGVDGAVLVRGDSLPDELIAHGCC